jgi:hypothetical protein
MNKPDIQTDLLKATFEQHWLHARHVEVERLWMTNIYVIILGVSIGFVKGNLYQEENIPLILFLMILSLFCIAFSLKIDSLFKNHVSKADFILRNYEVPVMSGYLKKHWVNRAIKISRLFPLFFSICFNGLLFVLLKILELGDVFLIIPGILFLILTFFFYLLKYDEFYYEHVNLNSELTNKRLH